MRYLFSIVLVICFFSCKTQEHENVLGKWIDKENENTEITFFEKEDKLLLDGFSFEFKVEKINDTVYTLNSDPEETTINLNTNANELSVGGRLFIRENKTLATKIRGSWVNNAISESTIYEFKQTTPTSRYNDCYVMREDSPNATYSPKKTEKGFEFTMGNEWVIFNFDENDKLYDDKGNKYTRITKE